MSGAPPEVAVLETGSANLASVLAALGKLGARPCLTRDPERVSEEAPLVVPGVGTLGAAMGRLRDGGLAEPLARRIRAGRPTLAICLGLQLLGESSEESPGVAGLFAFPMRAARFPPGTRTPQLGWNAVAPDPGCRLIAPGWAYFANSFRVVAAPDGVAAAWSDHGGPFVAAFERGHVLACQFHPELSGRFGLELVGRWLAAAREGGGAPC